MALIAETLNPSESNSTPHTTPDSSPNITPQSPYTPTDTPPASTFPITTSLIPASMISMNGIPLPPTMKRIQNKRHTTDSHHNHNHHHHHPSTDASQSSRSRIRIRRSSHSSTSSNSRSRSRSRTSKHRKNSNNSQHNNACDATTLITSATNHHNICDLTTLSDETPTSSSEEEDEEFETDSDIEIIDAVLNANNKIINDIPMLESRCNTNEAEDNFERYTLDGIGGKLLRKAGWDGNKHNLYEKEGPIEQSKKYQSLQRNKNGLGYKYINRGNRNKRNANKRIQRALVYPILTRPQPLPSAHVMNNNHRIRMPVINMNNNNNNNNSRFDRGRIRSNTVETAIEILSDDDIVREEEDDDVIVVDKEQVTKRRLNGIAFESIISKMCEESEETTRKYIKKQFAGSKRKLAVTKMVVSIKDSYSQTRIVVPARGKKCKHLQPFDAKCFLLRPKKYQKCTQCNMSIKKKDLIKMVYFQKIFDELKVEYDDVEQIEILKNAEWKVVAQKQGKQVMQREETHEIVDIEEGLDEKEEENDEEEEEIRKKIQEESVIILSSDDEDEEDGDKEKKSPEIVDLLDSSDSDADDDEFHEYEDISTEESGD